MPPQRRRASTESDESSDEGEWNQDWGTTAPQRPLHRRAQAKPVAGESRAISEHVHNYMRANDIYAQIKRILVQEGGAVDDEKVVAHLQQRGVVDEVVRALRHTSVGKNVGSSAPPADAAPAGPSDSRSAP